MSHHLDSPTAQEAGRVDITDVYVFAGESANSTVLIKDAYNKSLPRDDVAKYGEAIATFTAKVTQLAGTTTDPQAYGQHVVQFLLPDVLTYNPQLPVSYGFAGRNGRALADDTPDLILSLLANTPFSDRVGKPDGLCARFHTWQNQT